MIEISLQRQSGLQDRRANQVVFLLALACILGMLTIHYGFATTDGITDILTSNEVKGSQKYLGWMSWYGVLSSAIISIVSLMGLVQCIITFIATLAYYASPSYWDYVDALKQGNGSGLAAGNVEGLNLSSGFDAVIDALNSMNFNLKRYSDASTEYESNLNIDEYTTGWEYMMKKGPVLLIAVLFLNMGWKGTLQKILAATVDALTVYAEALPYQRMIDFAQWKAQQETGYVFTLGMSGTEEGMIKQRVAKDIFNKVQNVMRYTSKEDVAKLGSNVESYVASIEDKFQIPQHLVGTDDGNGGTISKAGDGGAKYAPVIWPALSIEVLVASNTASQKVNSGVYIPFSGLASGCSASTPAQKADSFAMKQYIAVSMSFKEYTGEELFKENKSWTLQSPTKSVGKDSTQSVNGK